VKIDETLPDALDGERLDRVVSMLDGCSRSVAADLVEGGEVSIDGTPVTQKSFRVASGMRITFHAVEAEDPAPSADTAVEYRVVHQDDHVIVVDKPAGLVVHPGAGRPDGTLVNGLLQEFPEIADVGQVDRPGIVHRLDGDTSGLLVVARTAQAYDRLTAALARHDVEREYLAAVDGIVVDDRGIVDAPIGRSTQRRTRMAVLADGRYARTHYEVLARDDREPAASWLRCRLETGRTHQIRVHLAAIGHPVLGDATYGNRATRTRFTRVALHAERLGFDHPGSGEHLVFEAPLPADLQALVANRFSGDT